MDLVIQLLTGRDFAHAEGPATPLVGSGYEASGAAKRSRTVVAERRPWRPASSLLQPRPPQLTSQVAQSQEAASSAAPASSEAQGMSTNAARRILMALETMSSVKCRSFPHFHLVQHLRIHASRCSAPVLLIEVLSTVWSPARHMFGSIAKHSKLSIVDASLHTALAVQLWEHVLCASAVDQNMPVRNSVRSQSDVGYPMWRVLQCSLRPRQGTTEGRSAARHRRPPPSWGRPLPHPSAPPQHQVLPRPCACSTAPCVPHQAI